ncbi:Heavy-metal-associated domain protein [Aspergillus sclerotialis]|uniref:Heavy-metal-associated domain protein n=1 Tax=Aspergillus sclerotialis TaxID=2070753 RepID=A0A3A2ZQM9_9EURO|nr:Heavy-metal-associated domain protein [Aspergillus sclerotialis]
MAPGHFTALSRIPSSQPSDTSSLKSIFFVSNVHCASCVAYVQEVLSEISAVSHVDVSIFTHEVRVLHGVATNASELATKLIEAAFEVHHVTTYDSKGAIVSDLDTTSWLSKGSMFFAGRPSSTASPSENLLHLANCDACRKEEYQRSLTQPGSTAPRTGGKDNGIARIPYENRDQESDIESLVRHNSSIKEGPSSLPPPQQNDQEFTARVSIGGMSCSSCVNAITDEVRALEFIKDINVNLLTNSATLVYTGPRSNIDIVIEHIEDIGFEASLDEVSANSRSSQTPKTFVAEVAISGMTCGSCVGTVTRGLEELPFVTKASVNLMSNSGRIEFEQQEKVGEILEKIEDLGYDASLSSVGPLAAITDETKSRTVSIHVGGMFCHHCPEKVINSLKDSIEVEFEEELSVKNPILKVTYTPSPSLTIRSILAAIDAAHSSFKASVYHPPTVEDRSQAMQQHERRRLLSRLLFVFIVAIPTFLIGIVFMSLVSSDNKIRKYLEHPIWVGNVSRIEWSLFIMTTPVMVYGTDVFHVRALKEIYTLWRPGSRVPILRRFYRFGSMNLLISAGTTVAYFSSLAVLIIDAVAGKSANTHSSSYFDSVVFLTLFILAGRYMEAYSKAKTGNAVASLGKLRPSEALLIDQSSANSEPVADGSGASGIIRVDVDLLEIGDIVRVPHGASPPADGVITGTGSYQFDESTLTGESKPVKKLPGDSVFTGSVNVGQPVQVKLSELGGSSMLDQIIAVVREGQSKRAPMERVADTLTSHFVPVITFIAISTFVIWLALGLSGTLPADYLDTPHGGWTFWALEFAISVFVVACPCGLALAAPTALFVGGGLAARNGILVKGGGEAFQEASRLNAIVFDKTGTLTEGGSLKVTEHEVLSKDPEKLEESSNHPIARAIMEFCDDKESASILSSDIHEIPGQGMRGTFTLSTGNSESDKHTVKYEAAIGNERLLQQIVSPNMDMYYLSTLLSKYQSAGKSTAILSIREFDSGPANGTFCPAIVFATSDLIRPEAVQVISKLGKRNVNVYMCTGDNQTTAHAVADMLGILRSNVMANVMPAEKAAFVRKIQENNGPSDTENQPNKPNSHPIVGFVGDGVNDSPALAAADVSIAMASGSDVAINSASFVLLNSDLNTILQLVLLSRRVFNRVKMNFGWAVIYNVILIPVAAGVLYPIVNGHRKEMIGGDVVMVNNHWRLSPVWAALAMALSSISVICSSLALGVEKRHFKKLFGLTG